MDIETFQFAHDGITIGEVSFPIAKDLNPYTGNPDSEGAIADYLADRFTLNELSELSVYLHTTFGVGFRIPKADIKIVAKQAASAMRRAGHLHHLVAAITPDGAKVVELHKMTAAEQHALVQTITTFARELAEIKATLAGKTSTS